VKKKIYNSNNMIYITKKKMSLYKSGKREEK